VNMRFCPMKNNIIVILSLLLAIVLLLLDRSAFQTELHELRDTVEQLRKSDKEMKDMIAEQERNLSSFERLFQKEKREQFPIFPMIVTLIAFIFAVALFFMLRKKMSLVREILEKQIETLKAESVAADSKFTELLETSLRISNPEPDHYLALKTGQEIHRMRKRIENMPPDTKGLGALKNSLQRLEEAFDHQGYEIVDLLGKSFTDGLAVHARFVPSDELNPGEQVITKVIQPQINFEGVLIQVAEVEVSVGE
jgi:hypothetical protein